VGDEEQEAVRAYVREFQKTYVEKMTNE
jgi:hypothetical protein